MRGGGDRGRSFDRSGGPPRGRGRSGGGRGRGGGGRGLSFSSRPRSSEGMSRERRDSFPSRGRGYSGRRSPGGRRSPQPGRRSPVGRRSPPMQRSMSNRRASPPPMSRYSPPPPTSRMSPPPRRQYSPPPRRDMAPVSPGGRDRFSDAPYSANGAGRDSGQMRYSRDDMPPRVSRDNFGSPPMSSSWNDRSRSPPPSAPRYRSRSPVARRRYKKGPFSSNLYKRFLVIVKVYCRLYASSRLLPDGWLSSTHHIT